MTNSVSISDLPNSSNTLGGFLTPIPKEFGLRVNEIDGGFLINNFGGKMATRTTLEETRNYVLAAFYEAFAPKQTTPAQPDLEPPV